LLKEKMASFWKKRWYSTEVPYDILRDPYAHAKPSIADPVPVNQGPKLNTPELQQLGQKAKGHWKELAKDEVTKCTLFYY